MSVNPAASRSPLHQPEPARRAPPEKLLVSPGEAAELLSIGRTYLYELIREGEIRSVQVGRLRRIPVAALREYVERLSGGR